MEKTFSQWKRQCLNKLDQSRKSSVDEGVEHVVFLLNGCEEYFTTSSCSGRIILIDGVPESCAVHKQNCMWLFVSHQKCKSEDLMSGLVRSTADAVLKFEPFVLHVRCRQLEDAQLVAVRSTHGLEVPLSHKGKLLVDNEYIHFLTKIANQKMEENHRRIQRFYQNLQSALSIEPPEKLQIPDTEISQELQDHPHRLETEKGEEKHEEEKNKTTVYKRRRKRDHHHQADCCHGDGSSSAPELDDCLDLFT
uniref:tRNA wybutosine-synthesizing protein 3 homolog isoform X2 n=1 Tax=Semicossyphus pulcher TaxID=241346 RepID=UPI0037E98931